LRGLPGNIEAVLTGKKNFEVIKKRRKIA